MKRKPPGYWNTPTTMINELTEHISSNSSIQRLLKNALEKYPIYSNILKKYKEEYPYSRNQNLEIPKEIIKKRLIELSLSLGITYIDNSSDDQLVNNDYKKRNSKYSPEEIEFLKNNRDKSFEFLAIHLKRHPNSVKSKFYDLGLKKDTALKERSYSDPWSDYELDILYNYAGKISDSEIIQKYLPHIKTTRWISRKRKELNLNAYNKQNKYGTKEFQGKIYYKAKKNENYYVRTEGNSFKYLHVAIYEHFFNVKIQRGQVIHHINGDSEDDDPSNLDLLLNQKQHQRLHIQLQKIGFDLFKLDYIGFDYETGEYYLKNKRRNVNE